MSSGSKSSGINKVTTGQSVKASAMVPAASKISAVNKKSPKRPTQQQNKPAYMDEEAMNAAAIAAAMEEDESAILA